jgi:hypothetical protein
MAVVRRNERIEGGGAHGDVELELFRSCEKSALQLEI